MFDTQIQTTKKRFLNPRYIFAGVVMWGILLVISAFDPLVRVTILGLVALISFVLLEVNQRVMSLDEHISVHNAKIILEHLKLMVTICLVAIVFNSVNIGNKPLIFCFSVLALFVCLARATLARYKKVNAAKTNNPSSEPASE